MHKSKHGLLLKPDDIQLAFTHRPNSIVSAIKGYWTAEYKWESNTKALLWALVCSWRGFIEMGPEGWVASWGKNTSETEKISMYQSISSQCGFESRAHWRSSLLLGKRNEDSAVEVACRKNCTSWDVWIKEEIGLEVRRGKSTYQFRENSVSKIQEDYPQFIGS